jgi:hypothetical protein
MPRWLRTEAALPREGFVDFDVDEGGLGVRRAAGMAIELDSPLTNRFDIIEESR